MATRASLLRTLLTATILVVGCRSLAIAQVWVPQGPAPAFFTADFPTVLVPPNSPIAGALEVVVAHPTDPDILWVGSVNGGVFRTDNATSPFPAWVPQTDGMPSLSIGALELDPTDGTHNTLLAGIGRQSSFGGDTGGVLAGVLRTTNGGDTWTALSPSLIGGNITGLAPRGSTVVASLDGPGTDCATIGIWRSTNGGTTFTQTSNGNGLPCGFAWDLASDPTDQTRLFTPITGLDNASDGLYRSDNTGASWTQVSSGALDLALASQPLEVQVAVGQAGTNANVFVAICDQRSLSGLFYSPDSGSSWQTLDLPMTTEAGPMDVGIHPGNQCPIHLSLVADPVDHSVVYIGGDRQPLGNEFTGTPGEEFPNSIGSISISGRLFRVDADLPQGSQATPITNCPTALPECGGSARTANNSGPHADSREMVFDALGRLIQTDDGGVYRHTNPRGTTGDWVSVIGDLRAVEQHDAAFDPISKILLSGNQDNGTTAQFEAGSPLWDVFQGADGGDVAVGPDSPVSGRSTRYNSNQNFFLATRREYNANNVLLDETEVTLTPLSGSPPIQGQFVTPMAVHQDFPDAVVVGAENGVYESFDRLNTVTLISATRVNSDQEGRGALAYGGAAGVMHWGAGNNVFVFRTPNSMIGPVSTPIGGFFPEVISDVVMDPDNSATAFAVSPSAVYGTNDAVFGGWFDITGDLFASNPSAGAINTVTYINQGGDRLVVGTQTGVFQTSDFATWTQLGTGLPNAPVYDLNYYAQNDLLVAGTMGRGAWNLSLDTTCPWELLFSGTTLNTPQSHSADGFIYLGPDLTADAAGIVMTGGRGIQLGNGTTIGGTFTADIASCP